MHFTKKNAGEKRKDFLNNLKEKNTMFCEVTAKKVNMPVHCRFLLAFNEERNQIFNKCSQMI